MKLSLFVLALLTTTACATSAGSSVAVPTADHRATHEVETPARIVVSEERSPVARGLAAYVEENDLDAASAFEQAYSLAREPSLLLARAQALRLAGACEEAKPLYEAFLREAPAPTYGTAVRKLADQCR
jgi:hypothetical protein